MKTCHSILVQGKKYNYEIMSHEDPEFGKLFHLKCESAGIDQDFDGEDLSTAIENLPQWILEFQAESASNKETRIIFRVKECEKAQIQQKALEKGFSSTSEFLRETAMSA